MKRPVLMASLLALLLSPFAYIGDAEAQRGRDRDRPRQTQQQPAEVRYPDATREDKRPEVNDRNYRQIARAFDDINEENYDRARSTLTSLRGNDRLTNYERALVYQGLAQLAYEEDDVDQAVEHWTRAIELDALTNNDHFQLMYQVAQLHLSEERYDESLQLLERWAEGTRSNNPDAMALRGNLLYRMERYREAITVLDQAIAATEQPQTALFELKMASYYEMDDYAGAARTLEQLIEREPNEIKHQINLAQTYIQLDQNERALGILAQARQRNLLTDASHWRQLHQLLTYADQPLEAAQVIRDGIESGHLPRDAANLRSLGDNYYLAEQIDQAIEAYRSAAALAPDDGNADQQLAHMLNEKERYQDSKAAIEAAFRKGNLRDPGIAYLLLGEAELQLGNRSAARTAFEQALNHDSSRSNAQIWLRNF